jgi:hypothetical protein
VLYLPATWADSFHSASGNDNHARLNVEALAWRQLWFSDVCGTLCTPQFIIPAAHIKATLPGSQTSQQDSGIGDPQVGGTLFFINQPDKREYSGLLTLITLPVGSYDAQHPDVSAGANRWVPLSLQLHPWRRQKLGAGSLAGSPVLRQQRQLSRQQPETAALVPPAGLCLLRLHPTYGALRLYHTRGGACA